MIRQSYLLDIYSTSRLQSYEVIFRLTVYVVRVCGWYGCVPTSHCTSHLVYRSFSISMYTVLVVLVVLVTHTITIICGVRVQYCLALLTDHDDDSNDALQGGGNYRYPFRGAVYTFRGGLWGSAWWRRGHEPTKPIPRLLAGKTGAHAHQRTSLVSSTGVTLVQPLRASSRSRQAGGHAICQHAVLQEAHTRWVRQRACARLHPLPFTHLRRFSPPTPHVLCSSVDSRPIVPELPLALF